MLKALGGSPAEATICGQCNPATLSRVPQVTAFLCGSTSSHLYRPALRVSAHTEAAEGVQAVPGAILDSRSAPTVDVHIYVTAVRSALLVLWTHCFVPVEAKR